MRKTGSVGQNGFTLVELSVATAIFSMGLGSFSLLLLLAVQGTTESRYHSMAVSQSASLSELVMMNSDALGHYVNPAPEADLDCSLDSSCTPEQMAASSLGDWQSRLSRKLPGGQGLVCLDSSPDDGDVSDPACDGGGNPVIKIFWEKPASGSGDEHIAPRHVARLPRP